MAGAKKPVSRTFKLRRQPAQRAVFAPGFVDDRRVRATESLSPETIKMLGGSGRSTSPTRSTCGAISLSKCRGRRALSIPRPGPANPHMLFGAPDPRV